MPTQYQAGAYSAVTHYLKAIQAAGTDQAEAVVAKMREMPVNDMFAKGGVLREDGRMVHDMLLMQVKKPSESDRGAGCLQDPRHHPRRRGLPLARRQRLPAGEEMTAQLRETRG